MSLVEVRNVACLFHRPDGSVLRAIDDVSLDVPRGRTVAIIGESGSGKSTLARLILGLYKTAGGSVRFDGTDIATLTKPEMRRLRARIGVVFQEPFEALNPRMRIGRIIEEPLVVHQPGLSRAERGDRVAAMLREVELDPVVADRYPAALSGGQQQRIGIARAFAVEPDILLMDEPFSHLDAMTSRTLREHLERIWLESRRTVMFVTHDVTEAVQLSDRIVVLAPGGRVHEIIDVDLPRPRRASDPAVALLQAEVLARFEALEAMGSAA